MNKYVEAALAGYDTARHDLEKFVRENTDFTASINDGGYPLIITLSPSEDAMQESLFEPDANGAIGEIIITCSSTGVGVDLGLKCHMQAARCFAPLPAPWGSGRVVDNPSREIMLERIERPKWCRKERERAS